MKPTRRLLAGLALTATLLTGLAATITDLTSPDDTAWGAPDTTTPADTGDTTVVTPLDTAWG